MHQSLRLRQVAQAVRIALACGTVAALPAQAVCTLDGLAITGTTTFSGFCVLDGTLTIAGKATLTNDGVIESRGQIDVLGRISGSGSFTNQGVLTVERGASAQFAQSGNLANQILTGGIWHLSGQGAKLSVGTGSIAINAATVWLSGTGTSFAQLSALERNTGSLVLDQGGSFVFADLYNTGTVTAASDASVRLTQSSNLAKGTLSGGRWEVYGGTAGAAGDKGGTSLVVGSGQIRTNAADILLSGAAARFDQLSALQSNQGSLTVQDGRSLSLADLRNDGTVTAAAGGRVSIQSSGNLVSQVLTGGRWMVVDDGQLSVGQGGIRTNAAEIVLRGAGATMTQLSSLASNTGTLAIEGGNSFVLGGLQKNNPLSLNNDKGGLLRVDGASTLQVASRGVLTNRGQIDNAGTLLVDSKFESLAEGLFSNAGTLRVQDGGTAIVRGLGSQFVDGVLMKGNWEVAGLNSQARLILGDGSGDAIRTNQAQVRLSGSKASFDQILGLERNEGVLAVDSGFVFNAVNLRNTGSIVVGAGGTAALAQSASLSDKGSLLEGDWQVVSSDSKQLAKLSIGSGAIERNEAKVLISGVGARFAQISSLVSNSGRLKVDNGATLTLARLDNSGTVEVGPGSSLNIANPIDTIDTNRLVQGSWIIDGVGSASVLRIGSAPIHTNSGTVVMRGALAGFANLGTAGKSYALTTNAGSLRFEASANALFDNLRNTGTLAVGAGSTVIINSSKSRSTTTLLEGEWLVQSEPGLASRLTLDGAGSDRSAISANAATVVLDGAEAQFKQLSGLTSNSGKLSILGGNVFTAGALVNTGSIVVDARSTLDTTNDQVFRQTGGSTDVNGLLAMAKLRFDGGVLMGNGRLRASSIVVGADALVAPGHSPGRLTFDGDTQFNGTLGIEIVSPTAFDVLDATGSLTFGSKARVNLLLGFAPSAPAYRFDFLHAAELINAPSFTVQGLTTGYRGQMDCGTYGCSFALTQVAAPVPEPHSYALFLAGLAAIALGARRRRAPAPRPSAG